MLFVKDFVSGYIGIRKMMEEVGKAIGNVMLNLGAVEIKGIQLKGVYVYIKHFAFNDSETNCRCISIYLDERAAREVYLKAFETAVVEGSAGSTDCCS